MIASMTGFARAEGDCAGLAWAWELRSVNGRGLELRLRLPPGMDALEPAVREAGAAVLRRGNVTANLTTKRAEPSRFGVDPAVLDQVLALALDLAAKIPGAEAPRAEALLALPGVLRAATPELTDEPAAAGQAEALRAGFAQALQALVAARRAEGMRLAKILAGLLDEIATLHAAATAQAAGQPAAQRQRMLDALAPLLAELPALPEERIAQEVALLAARSDVREELDRLGAHVAAARALLAEGGAVGRRFDFLLQEFNREVNTLCSKSASVPLTDTGLRLKVTVEQLREQVQNVE
jgi:uncharacterized protein (TIGR00255 family)